MTKLLAQAKTFDGIPHQFVDLRLSPEEARDLIAHLRPQVALPVLPGTCGECQHFERWNDGICTLDEAHVNAERLEPPPKNCPLNQVCHSCGAFPSDQRRS